MDSLINRVRQIAQEKRSLIEDLADFLWQHPETGLVEYQAVARMKELLREEGFSIEENVAGIETAFIASWGQGQPVIGFSCEYDALPGMSQALDVFSPSPLAQQEAGHACGHNLLGSGALGAALVVAQYLKEEGLTASVKVLGTPSEERDAAKVFMGRDGYFNDLDFALSWHPESFNGIWDGGSLANTIALYRFTGRSAHAAASPHLGRSALDAAELMNIGVNYLREHIPSQARLHSAYLNAGGPAPNIIPAQAELCYFIRSPKIEDSVAIYERVNDVARGAALMTGTSVDIDLQVALADFVPNQQLSSLLYESMLAFGLPAFDQEDLTLAQKYQASLAPDDLEGIRTRLRASLDKQRTEEVLASSLMTTSLPFDPSQGPGPAPAISSDIGDLSHYTPTAQMFLASAALGTPLHSWQMTAQAGSSIGKKALYSAVGILATTALGLVENPSLLEAIQQEFKEEVGHYQSIVSSDIQIRDPKKEK